MSAITTKIIEKYNLSFKMSVTDLSQYTSEFLENLTDNLSASDVKAEACALANSASNANASSSPLADVIIMLCICPAELISLHITDAGKPGVKRFNRFLKDYDLIPHHLHKIGAVYAIVVHEAKNLAYAMTIAREALHHNPNNNTSLAQNYVV
ncbi:16215_t:CDS:2, partial [Gigaspora margarita]